MILPELQKRILDNKKNKGFNTTNIDLEFCLLYGEVAESFDAYRKGLDVGEELADVAIYLLGLSEILGINLEDEIYKKMKINENRTYHKSVNGTLVKDN